VTQPLAKPDPNRLPIRPLSLSKNSSLIVKELLLLQQNPPALPEAFTTSRSLHSRETLSICGEVVFSTLRSLSVARLFFQKVFTLFFKSLNQLFNESLPENGSAYSLSSCCTAAALSLIGGVGR